MVPVAWDASLPGTTGDLASPGDKDKSKKNKH